MDGMTRQIKKSKLDFKKTLNYFIEHLSCGNTLSTFFLDKINLEQGSFFTLLPNNAMTDQLYAFSWGGIIPSIQYGTEKYNVNGCEFQPKQVITMDKELSIFIFNFLNNNQENFVIIENVIADVDDPHIFIDGVEILFNENEVYYFLDNKNSIKQIYQTIRMAGEIWHFLAILTHGMKTRTKNITKDEIEMICENASFAIASAYDGEGYIFWEKGQLI